MPQTIFPSPLPPATLRLPAVAAALASALSLAALTGCVGVTAPNVAPAARPAFSGLVHGGQQAVNGAKIYLYSVSTSGYASAAHSLLNGAGYVVSDANGNFSITGDYTPCASGTYVYLLALGGNPGLPVPDPANPPSNPELALAAGLGDCSLLTASSYFSVNEVTTVAFAYTMAQFAANETMVGVPGNGLTGLANAFANIPNLIDPVHGFANATTPGGNGVVPQSTLNSLANSLAACVNSNGAGTPCSNLMTAANVTGSGGTPIDTFQAALNIAQHPGVNVAAIYDNTSASAPFAPALSGAPNDWTILVQYTGAPNPRLTSSPNTCFQPVPDGGPFTDICQAQGIAIDSMGNVWVSVQNPDNNGPSSFEQGQIVKFSPIGVELSPAGGYTAPSLYRLQQVAIDQSDNVWVGSRTNPSGSPDSLVEVTQGGVVQTFTGGGISRPRAVAVDAYGNIWTAGRGALAEFTSAGAPVSGPAYQSSSLLNGTFKMAFDTLGNAWIISYDLTNYNTNLIEFTPDTHAQNVAGTYGGTFTKTIASTDGVINQGMAIDPSNNIWYGNAYNSYSAANGGTYTGNGFLTEYSNSGVLQSGSGYTSGGIANPNDVVIDGSGNVFAVNSKIGEVANNGSGIAPATGYATIPDPNGCCFGGAIDNSGSLWFTGGYAIYQMIGIATPVITPIAANLPVQLPASVKK